MNQHLKKVLTVFIVALLLYLYQNFIRGDMDVITLVYEFLRAGFGLIARRADLISPHVKVWFYDAIILVVGLLFWVLFFSQFTLPVHILGERLKVFPRMLRSLGENRGPAIYIRDGELVKRLQEEERRGPGVILVDTASAAVLTDKGKFTDTIGPGLTFTEKNEFITNTVDLHKQIRILGPREGDVVFPETETKDGADHKENGKGGALPEEKDEGGEAQEKLQIAQERRLQTSGLTRDGIEIVPNIIVIFRLDSDLEVREDNEDIKKTRFGYNKDAVTKAIRAMSIDPSTISDQETRKIPWDWLPALLAADLWREYLRKFTINQLFEINEPRITEKGMETEEVAVGGQTTFDFIIKMINQRLTKPIVLKVDSEGNPVSGTQKSRENKLLTDSGIKVLAVRVDNLRLRDEEKLIDRWKATWLMRAQAEKGIIQRHHSVLEQKAEEEAIKDFSNKAAAPLYQLLEETWESGGIAPTSAQLLERFLRGTRTNIVRDPNLNAMFSEERAGLDSIIEWLQEFQNGREEA